MRQTNSRLQSHWASLVQKDPAPLHATICVAASNCAVRSGEFPLLDPTKSYSSTYVFDAFHHRGETIKLVNSGLSNPAKASSDALIAAVSILISIEVRITHCGLLVEDLMSVLCMRHYKPDISLKGNIRTDLIVIPGEC